MLEIGIHISSGIILLIAGGEGLVRGASSIALRFGIPSIVIGLTIVALGTSAPELAVSIKASLDGNPEIAMANIIGSNIFNILFILGLSSLIIPLSINISIIRREIPFLIFVSFLFYGLLWDQILSQLESLLLLTVCAAYTFFLIKGALKEKDSIKPDPSRKNSPIWLSTSQLLGGLIAIAFGAKYLVLGASELARSWGVSETIIGLTIVACGTSLPEVVASVLASLRGERDLAIGNVVGSNLYNILFIGGFSGSISKNGLRISDTLQRIDIPVMLFATIICFPFFRTGKVLSRPEGCFLLLGFSVYLIYLIRIA